MQYVIEKLSLVGTRHLDHFSVTESSVTIKWITCRTLSSRSCRSPLWVHVVAAQLPLSGAYDYRIHLILNFHAKARYSTCRTRQRTPHTGNLGITVIQRRAFEALESDSDYPYVGRGSGIYQFHGGHSGPCVRSLAVLPQENARLLHAHSSHQPTAFLFIDLVKPAARSVVRSYISSTLMPHE